MPHPPRSSSTYPVWGVGRVRGGAAAGYGLVVRQGAGLLAVESFEPVDIVTFANHLIERYRGPEAAQPAVRPRRIALDQADFGRQTAEPLQSFGLPVWTTAARTRPHFQARLEAAHHEWLETGGDYGPFDAPDVGGVWTPAVKIGLYMTFVFPDEEIGADVPVLMGGSVWAA